LNLYLIFLIKFNFFFKKKKVTLLSYNSYLNKPSQYKHDIFKNPLNLIKNKNLKKKQISTKKYNFFKNSKKVNFFLFLNKFLLNFVEIFFKEKIIFNLKKGNNKLILKQISFRKFTTKYFKRNLKVTKQIIGVLYYSFLLKDATLFVNFFKIILERINLKLHKKVFLGLRKLIKDLFKPLFLYLGVLGIFFNIKGKIGVSGSAKKRRYFFFFGKHSITTKTLKVDLKSIPV
jgi:hypothetical protein